jgi:hypothetical protein
MPRQPVPARAGRRPRPVKCAAPVGLAWYSMLGSYRLLRQMAQVSVQMAQDHIATAFHFLISKRLPDLEPLPLSAGALGSAASTSMASTSAMAPAKAQGAKH